MKKFAAILLAMALLAFTGCSAGGESSKEIDTSNLHNRGPQVTAEPTPAPTPAPTPVPTPTPLPETMNLLTGELTLSPEAVGKRPVAVMVNNSSDNLPQYGITDADLIFEIPVEADITRMMCMYGDYTKVPDICSVRSCRYYYPMLSEGFDAMYVHWGMDPTIAAQTLNELGVDNIDGAYYTYNLFGRDEDKMNQGYAIEHCSVFYGSQMKDALAENGYRTDLREEKKAPFFQFNGQAAAAVGEGLTQFRVQFGGGYFSDFSYDAASKTYFKDHNGSPHMDARTEKQLAFSNVLLMETPIGLVPGQDAGLRTIEVAGSGSGYYMAGGTVEPITWEKAGATDPLLFFTSSGRPLTLNTGKTYIAVCNSGSLVTELE